MPHSVRTGDGVRGFQPLKIKEVPMVVRGRYAIVDGAPSVVGRMEGLPADQAVTLVPGDLVLVIRGEGHGSLIYDVMGERWLPPARESEGPPPR